MDRQIWTGMTAEQLVDCLGQPEGVDHQVSARKQKEVRPYRPKPVPKPDHRREGAGGGLDGPVIRERLLRACRLGTCEARTLPRQRAARREQWCTRRRELSLSYKRAGILRQLERTTVLRPASRSGGLS
jgi:hypothetical protein